MSMLEDMAVGVADLDHVSFKLVLSTKDTDDAVPHITGNRYICNLYILIREKKNLLLICRVGDNSNSVYIVLKQMCPWYGLG